VIQTEAQPVLPFDAWELYAPSLTEWAAAGLVVAYGVILLSLSYRCLPIFTPDEPAAEDRAANTGKPGYNSL
jgi:molybdopterin-containing oxidoreductase family membrane subunit